MRAALTRPKLPGASEQPLAPQLRRDLLIRDDSTGFLVGLTAGHSLDDVEVILHLIKAAIIRETIKKRANRVFRRHEEPIIQEMSPECEFAGRNSTSVQDVDALVAYLQTLK